jgi:hypothetical protein
MENFLILMCGWGILAGTFVIIGLLIHVIACVGEAILERV